MTEGWFGYLEHELGQGRIKKDDVDTQTLTPLPVFRTCQTCPFIAKKVDTIVCGIFEDKISLDRTVCQFGEPEGHAAGTLIILTGGMPGGRKFWEGKLDRNELSSNRDIELF